MRQNLKTSKYVTTMRCSVLPVNCGCPKLNLVYIDDMDTIGRPSERILEKWKRRSEKMKERQNTGNSARVKVR